MQGDIEHTSDILLRLYPKAHDPCKQVACIIYDTETMEAMAWGVNEVGSGFSNLLNLKEILDTPIHPAKKLIMTHAEENAVDHLLSNRMFLDKSKLGAYCSLQPCMNCVKKLAPIVSSIEWLEDNRHQEEQALIFPYTVEVFKVYRPNKMGLMLKTKDFW